MTPSNNFFDAAAATWDDDPRRLEMAGAIVRAIREKVSLSTEMDAFDYGCGTGLLSVMFAPLVRRITGADSSEGMIRALRNKISQSKKTNMEAVKLDLEQDPVPAGRYHLVVSGMAMHHIGDVKKVVSAFYELLLPGGALCIADLDTEPGTFHGGGSVATVRHLGFEREAILKVMAEAGFSGCAAATAYTIRKVIADGTEREFPVFMASGIK